MTISNQIDGLRDLGSITSTLVPERKRWLVAAGAAIGMMGGFLPVFFATIPFFLLPLTQEFGWTRAEATSGTVFGMLGVAVGSMIVGNLYDRFGVERIIAVSAVFLISGLAILSELPNNLFVLRALSFTIGATGCATTYVGYNSVLTKWFDRNLGIAFGIAGVGSGVGFTLAPFVSASLINEFGWRGAYLGLAAVAFCLGMLAFLLIPVRNHIGAPKTAQPQISGSGEIEREGVTLGRALLQWRFWLLILIVFFSTFSTFGAVAHSASVITDRGLQLAQAATVASLGSGLTGLVAKPIMGALLDRFQTPIIAVVLFLFGAFGLYNWAYAATLPMFMVAAAFTGFTIGAEGDLIPFWVRRYFGTRSFGKIYGIMFGAVTLGGVAGPLVFGYAFDFTGSYANAMLGASGSCVFCAVATACLGKYRFRSKLS